MSGVIYKVEMQDVGVVYVGQTRQKPEARWRQHAVGRTALSRALRLFGAEEYFTFSVVEEVTVEKLDARERHWISHFGTLFPNGLNITPGGSNNSHRPESLAKMAAAKKLACACPEHKAKVSATSKRLWKDPTYREKVLRRSKETKGTAEFKAKISEIKTEMWKSDERKVRARQKAKQQWADPEKRARMTEALQKARREQMQNPAIRAEQTRKRLESRRRNQLTTYM